MIDTFFPIVLVLVGLALSVITIFRSGVPRLMNPHIYYNKTDPNPQPIQLIHNDNSYFIDNTIPGNEKLIENFIKNNVMFGNETKGWNL